MRIGVTSQNLLRRGREAFTLLELLMVLFIIGLIAAIGLPKISGIGRANASGSAQRQLLDDLNLARQRAIANRSDVYMVFVTPAVFLSTSPDYINPTTLTAAEARVYTNLLAGQYTAYALISERQVGDQPGVHTKRYLTEWHTLPDGVYIATNKFWSITGGNNGVMTRFDTNSIPFPLASSKLRNLPYIAFNYLGQLVSGNDTVIPLVRGSIFYARNAGGQLIPAAPDVLENPPGNSDPANTMSMRIRIDWLTGRAHVEQVQVQ